MAGEIRQKVYGMSLDGKIILRSKRGKLYSVELGSGVEIDMKSLSEFGEETPVYATIDTDSDPWECIDIEIGG